ncbi:MAG: gamma-glutamylcyclotransferase [Betaproteobacteria bacterium]|nr:gamma-glutamylcyclotransferase [Betaproteobacteria bacterium]
MNRFVWAMARLWIRLRSGRNPPLNLPDPVWYFAYGSNMNERLFRERRHMTPIESKVARLDGYRLCFTVAGGRRPGSSAPANIRPAPGDAVYGVLYLLPLRKFTRLDASEGRQYAYLEVGVRDASGAEIRAMSYIGPAGAPDGRPSRAYLEIVRAAARERGLPAETIAFLGGIEPREESNRGAA